MKFQYDNIFLGFSLGLLLPVLFMWAYLKRFYPGDLEFVEILKQLYPSPILGKIFMLSIVPDLGASFFFYKKDKFRIGGGLMLAAVGIIIASLFIM